jgi:GT2 family glycosyltransferase
MDKIERVSIVIPNWNGKKLLPVCLDSLRKQTFRDFVVYVVDNGSKDGSAEFMEASYPEVRVVRNSENLGFAEGMNVGIREAKGEYIVSLNNDHETAPNWLAEIVKQMDKHPQMGSAASALLDFKDRNRIDSLGDGYSWDGRSYKIGSAQVFRPLTEPFEILCPCAAASVYRSSMLERIGLFDKDFFAYMEDVDLGLRAQLAGYRSICIPTAFVYHMGSATSGGGASAFTIRQTTRNIYRVIIKNVPLVLLPVFIFFALTSQLGLVVLSLVLPQFRWFRIHVRAYFEGLAQAYRDLPGNFAKRRQVAGLKKLGTVAFVRMILASYRLARNYESQKA